MAPKVMSDAQRIAFETNGFLTIPNALMPEELAAIRAEAEQAERTWDATPGSPGFKKPQLWEIMKPTEYGEKMLSLLWHPQVFPIVREILGDGLACGGGAS